MENEYKIFYLPQARLDVAEILDYFLQELKNPSAAERFGDKLDEKIVKLERHPFIGALYKWNHKFDYEYRQLFVGSYTVFYVVLEKNVEIHRVIYSARNMEELI